MRSVGGTGRVAGLLAAAAVAAIGCGAGAKHVKGGEKPEPGTADTAPADRSLYDRVGGADALAAVVHDFVAGATADARLAALFAKTDLPALERNLTDQICRAAGGPCTYEGRAMAEAGVGVTDEQFPALVENLSKSLDAHGVAGKEKAELIAWLESTRGDGGK